MIKDGSTSCLQPPKGVTLGGGVLKIELLQTIENPITNPPNMRRRRNPRLLLFPLQNLHKTNPKPYFQFSRSRVSPPHHPGAKTTPEATQIINQKVGWRRLCQSLVASFHVQPPSFDFGWNCKGNVFFQDGPKITCHRIAMGRLSEKMPAPSHSCAKFLDFAPSLSEA